MEENYERKRRAREAWEREQERIAEAKEREKRNREYEAQTRYERVVYVQPYTADGRRRSLLEQLRLEAKADSLPPDSLEVCVVYRPINPRETVINARPAVRLQAELDAISFCSAEGVWGLEALQRLTRTCKADMQRARRRLERIEVDRRSWECLLEALQERDKYVQIAKPILEMQDGPEKDRLCRQHPIEVDHYTQAVLALQGHEGLQCSEASARIAENKAAAAKAQEEYEGSLKRYRGARNARNCEARRLYSPEQPTAQREHYGRPHRTTGDEFFCEYQRRYDLFLERLKEAAAQR